MGLEKWVGVKLTNRTERGAPRRRRHRGLKGGARKVARPDRKRRSGGCGVCVAREKSRLLQGLRRCGGEKKKAGRRVKGGVALVTGQVVVEGRGRGKSAARVWIYKVNIWGLGKVATPPRPVSSLVVQGGGRAPPCTREGRPGVREPGGGSGEGCAGRRGGKEGEAGAGQRWCIREVGLLRCTDREGENVCGYEEQKGGLIDDKNERAKRPRAERRANAGAAGAGQAGDAGGCMLCVRAEQKRGRERAIGSLGLRPQTEEAWGGGQDNKGESGARAREQGGGKVGG